MKNDMIFDKLEDIITRLNEGERVDPGEFKVVWDFATTTLFELLEQKKNAEMTVNEELIDMIDRLVIYVNALMEHHEQVFEKKDRNHESVPYTVPQFVPVFPPHCFTVLESTVTDNFSYPQCTTSRTKWE